MRDYMAATILVALLMLTPVPAAAQSVDDRWAADAWAGVTMPTMDVGILHDQGPHVGVGVGYRVSPRLQLRAEVAADFLLGGGFSRLNRYLDDVVPHTGARLDYYHWRLGAELDLARPSREKPWRISANAGIGATTLDVEASPINEAITRTNPAFHGAVVLGYRVSETVELLVRGAAHVVLGDAEDPDDYLGKELVLPFSAGIRLTP